MLKYIVILFIALALIGAVAGLAHLRKVSVKNKKEMAKYTGSRAELSADLGKTLVIYYSLSGNTRDIASRIQKLTGADMYEIQTAEALKKVPMLYMEVKNQLKSGQYPALKPGTPDLSAYKTIFVGSPIWWYTASTPVLSFLEQTDFMGKRVAPFCTQGSNYGTFFEDFKAKAKNAKILKGESFNNIGPEYDEAVNNKIIIWLNGLSVN